MPDQRQKSSKNLLYSPPYYNGTLKQYLIGDNKSEICDPSYCRLFVTGSGNDGAEAMLVAGC